MKVFILVLGVCIIGAFADTDEDQLLKFRDECIAESGVEDVILKRLKDNDWDLNDPKLQCYAKCMWLKTGVMKSDETFDVEKMKSTVKRNDVSAEKVQADIDACTAITDDDSCMKALKVAHCLKTHSETHNP